MDFNTETFVKNNLAKFRRAIGLYDLTIGELYAILRWVGIKPIRREGNSYVYPKYRIEQLLNTHITLMNVRNKILKNRKTEELKKSDTITYKSPLVNKVNYYSSKDMEDASNDLLRKQEVYFNDSEDDILYESLFTKNIYITESQYKMIKERLLNGKENELEKYDNVKEDSDVYKKIKKRLDFKNNSNLKLHKIYKVTNKQSNEIFYVAEIYGGLNGCGEWNNYLDDIQYALLKIGESWVVDLSCDCADDVWTLQIGFKYPSKSTLKEGCWGYEWYDSDQALDECNVFAKKILSMVSDNIRKKINKKDFAHVDYIYGYLGVIFELLKTEEIFKEYLTDNDTYFELQDVIKQGYNYCIEHKKTYNNPEKFEKKINKLKDELDKLLNKKYTKKSKRIINENQNIYFIDTNKVNIVKKFLDSTFVRASMPIIDKTGLPVNKPIIGLKDNSGNVVKNLSPKQLFYLIQDKFKNIYSDKNKRDKLLRQIIIDWYNDKISKEGLLSVNNY